MSKKIINLEKDGHKYRILPVECSDNMFVVIKDGTKVRQICHNDLFVGDDIIDVTTLF